MTSVIDIWLSVMIIFISLPSWQRNIAQLCSKLALLIYNVAKVHLIFCLRYVVWNDATCEKSGRRFFCKFSDVPVFHLRGLSDCQVQLSTVVHFHFFLAQLEAFDYKFKWTKTLEKVLQIMWPWKGNVYSKAFNTKSFKLTITGSIHPGWVPRF